MSDERKPLWSDDEIIEQYKMAFGHSPDVHHMAFACWMRDQYETVLAERDERIRQLEAQLAEAKGDAEYWHGMYLNDGENTNHD